jgi:glycosyltransferase involved in cell wall biosynthesis
MKPIVSIVICVRNGGIYTRHCLESLLDQTFKDFELLIIDDASSDNTSEIISAFNDPRIKYLKNNKWLGIPKSRNIGLKYAVGKYVFFTDADCIASKDWIEEGLKYLADDYVGVEGRIFYVSSDFQPTFSDHVMENRKGGEFMTGNVAYRRNVIEVVRGFDEKMTYHADRDIGLKIRKYGKIGFNANMIVFHRQVVLTPSSFLKMAARAENTVYLFKRFGDRTLMYWRIWCPFTLAKMIFPPLTFASLFFHRFKKKEDFNLLPYSYIYAVLERLHLWRMCARERVLMI